MAYKFFQYGAIALIAVVVLGSFAYLRIANPLHPPQPVSSLPINLGILQPSTSEDPVSERLYEGMFEAYHDQLDTRILIDGMKYATVQELNRDELLKLVMVYGDVTGDGINEAVVAIPSGGTAGNLGVLIYGLVNKKVTLLDEIQGYKIGGLIENHRLVTQVPFYLENEPNCCPSQFDVTTYDWDGENFVATTTKRLSYLELYEPEGYSGFSN
jgi:hypothetical protein